MEGESRASTSTTSFQDQSQIQNQTSITYRVDIGPRNLEPCAWLRDDMMSCIVISITFWVFVSMTILLGVYGSSSFQVGPNCSLLIQPNPWFVANLKVEQSDDTITGPTLFGLYNEPPLDVITTWSETHNTSLLANSHKEWVYFLNVGSQINISYVVDAPNSSPSILVIAEGSDGLLQWLEDPSYPNTTMSWNIISESGMIQQRIMKSAFYYIAVANLNSEDVEVELRFKFMAFLYNTTGAYYKCSLAWGDCSLGTLLPEGNAAVLTTSVMKQDTIDAEWYIKLSYGPRWATYLFGIGALTALMSVAFHFFTYGCVPAVRNVVSYRAGGSERAPLLSHKDDDLSSLGSSYDSLSQDDEDPEDGLMSHDGKPLKDGEYNQNMRRLCAICFDAPRDCFFLPCGHCVACFACGTRIAEVAGTCPICRKNLKKVRKIYTA